MECLFFSLLYEGVNTVFVAADTKKQPREPHTVTPQTGLFVSAALAEKTKQLWI